MGQFEVSDHALVRYMERVLGLNLNKIKKRILSEEVRQALELGARQMPCPEEPKLSYILKDNTVITIMNTTEARRKKR